MLKCNEQVACKKCFDNYELEKNECPLSKNCQKVKNYGKLTKIEDGFFDLFYNMLKIKCPSYDATNIDEKCNQ